MKINYDYTDLDGNCIEGCLDVPSEFGPAFFLFFLKIMMRCKKEEEEEVFIEVGNICFFDVLFTEVMGNLLALQGKYILYKYFLKPLVEQGRDE